MAEGHGAEGARRARGPEIADGGDLIPGCRRASHGAGRGPPGESRSAERSAVGDLSRASQRLIDQTIAVS